MPPSRVVGARAVNLVPRPKTSLGMSCSSPGFVAIPAALSNLAASPSSPQGGHHQWAPRHDHDMTNAFTGKEELANTSTPSIRAGNYSSSSIGRGVADETKAGDGGNIGSAGFGDELPVDSPINDGGSTLSHTLVESTTTWPSPERKTVGKQQQLFQPQQRYERISWSGSINHVPVLSAGYTGGGSGAAIGLCYDAFVGGSRSGGSSRPSTIHTLRRSSSDAGGSRCHSSRTSRRNKAESVSDSTNPEVLRGEIRRLQAALMNEFKGGNRFVGGAQFKASGRKQAGGCGGCLQVREALRRSRVESRDLRSALFRAEGIIKQLTLTRGLKRTRIKTGISVDASINEASESGAGGSKRDSLQGSSTLPNVEAVGNDERNGSDRLSSDRGASSSAPFDRMASFRRGGSKRKERQPERDLQSAHAGTRSQGIGGRPSVEEADGQSGLSGTVVELGRSSEGGGERRDTDTQNQNCRGCSELRRLVAKETAKVKATQTEQTLQESTREDEEAARAREKLESESAAADEEVQRLRDELDGCRRQALLQDEQVQRLSDQQGILRAEASITIQRLGRAETDLETAGAALQGERFLRERGESTAEGLKRELSERKEDCENLRREAAAEREARRRSESQAASTELVHRNALKAALNSSVRLCVVAPTVNINLDDRSSSFCSGLPERKIRDFVEGAVLPRFTRVLLQPGVDTAATAAAAASVEAPLAPSSAGDACSRKGIVVGDTALRCALGGKGSENARGRGRVSDGGLGNGEREMGSGNSGGDGQADFDKWLRDMLVDMQTSIELYVASVFRSQTATGQRQGSGFDASAVVDQT